MWRSKEFSDAGKAVTAAVPPRSLDPGSRAISSVSPPSVFSENRRSNATYAPAGSVAVLTLSRRPSSADAPTGSRAGSGIPGTTPGAPRTSAQVGARSGQPTPLATSSATASTTGELATDAPDSGTSAAPSWWARRSARVESGTHTCGRGLPSERASPSAACVASLVWTSIELHCRSRPRATSVNAGAMSADAVTRTFVGCSQAGFAVTTETVTQAPAPRTSTTPVATTGTSSRRRLPSGE